MEGEKSRGSSPQSRHINNIVTYLTAHIDSGKKKKTLFSSEIVETFHDKEAFSNLFSNPSFLSPRGFGSGIGSPEGQEAKL